MLYSLDNGTNWHNSLATNSSNFSPSNNSQILSHTVTTGYIISLDNFRVKFKFLHNTGDWEAIIDDFKRIVLTPTYASTSTLDLANLSFYPNPVTDRLNIDYKENISNLTVYDLSGRSVKSLLQTTVIIQ